MGFSHKSHGKRSDKETQSPMLKIFKDMMQKDKRDPEKTNLLKDRHPERKKKHYSGSRSKSGHKTVSSSSDHPKKEPQYKRSDVEARNAHFESSRSQRSVPFQSEKRESWWFWGSEPQPKGKAEEDTCSCVSCAFKRLLSTDYACMLCVAAIFIISVAIAVYLVYRSMPSTIANIERNERDNKMFYQKPENERLKRKINGLGKWSFGPKKEWRNMFSKSSTDFDSFNFQGNDLASLVESENQLAKILDSDKLTEIQHSERLKDFYKKLVQTDAAIRNLRKSMNDNSYTNNNFDINNNFDFGSSVDFDSNDIDNFVMPDRSKRSVKLYPNRIFHFKRREPSTQSKIDNGKLITKTTVNMTANKKIKDNQGTRNKRFDNFTDGSFVIEKNKVVIQYKPNRKVAKCSHSPKDSKSHETQLTHPFYKNTQRLDELLDQMMDKKIPNFLSDRSHLGIFFDNNKKCKHPPSEEIILVKDDDLLKDYDQEKNQPDQSKDQSEENNENNRNNILTSDLRVETEKTMKNKEKIETTHNYGTSIVTTKVPKNVEDPRNIYANDFFENSNGVEKKLERSMPRTTPKYDILLSISTLSNQPVKPASNYLTTNFPERPNMRKLQQINMKEEDGVAYEDLKQVLADYKEGHDEDDKEGDRKKRTLQDDIQEKVASMKNFPSNVHNPNWKGAMPLYPEELTEMMKSDTNVNTNKNKDENSQDYKETPIGDNQNDFKEVPVHNRDVAAEGDEASPKKTDVEYVEDYLENGYEKLVELAQAYSDYGVLKEKKEMDAEKKLDKVEHIKANKKRISLGLRKRIRNSFKRGMKKNAYVKTIPRDHLKEDLEESEGIRIEIQPNKKGEPLKPTEAENYKSIKDILQKHVKVVNDIKCVENIKPQNTVGSEMTPRVEFRLPATFKYKTNKPLDTMSIPDVLYKKRTLKPQNKYLYEATDKIISNNFNEDKFEHKRETNNPEEIDLDVEAEKLKRATSKYEKKYRTNDEPNNDGVENGSTESIFANAESEEKFPSKREIDKIKDDNDKITKIAENSLLISQSMEKFKVKRDINSTIDENEIETNGSLNSTQIKRGIFNTLSNKEKSLDEKHNNTKVNGKTGSKAQVENKNITKSNSSSLSNFFNILSNWFSSLDEIEMAENGTYVTSRPDRAITNISNSNSSESKLSVPLYDSDMIENIGRRSRVLLSIAASNSTEKDAGSGSDDEENQIASSTDLLATNNTSTTKDAIDQTKAKASNTNNTENHKVKRQAIDDSNLIFWNDLYDEEYGINADPIDNNIRDKHSADFLKKSNTWIQDKVKRIADKFYARDSRKDEKSNEKIVGNKKDKRSVKYEDDEEDNTVKLDLATLTEKMKEVCKETVRAVQETKHIQVREENREGQAASSLMQQLVRLMTDLVDYQVQARTCRKLPADLQRFLDWLTANKDEDADNDDDLDKYTEKTTEEYDMSFENKLDKPVEEDLLQPSSERGNSDSKTDCLGTLHAVQNLIKEYEEMSEDDKSLMTGVKTYLENQANYLQKQLTIEDRQFNKSRYSRDIAKVGHRVAQSIDVTAKNLDREYKIFKKKYQKYKGKVGSLYKQVLKTTEQFKDSVTGALGKKVGKTTIKPRCKQKHTKPSKIDENIIAQKKDKVQALKPNSRKHGFFHSKNAKKRLKSNVNVKGKTNIDGNYKDVGENLQEFQDNSKDGEDLEPNFNRRTQNNAKDAVENIDQAVTEKDGRNIKDVYFKAVEEAKKATLSKTSHLRDGNVFDKTDVFRINDDYYIKA